MGRLLTATTVGAVLGPNLLGPSSAIGTIANLPALVGPYLVAIVCFAIATLTLWRAPARETPKMPASKGSASWSRQNLAGLFTLSAANLVMIAVMTMAPLHMEHLGSGLTVIGVVVSVHIAGMFLPSSASAWLTARIGGIRASVIASLLLAIACIWAASTHDVLGMAGAMLAGWNLALLSGSALIIQVLPEHVRPRREGLGDASGGLAAAAGGIASGALMQATSYAILAASAAAVTIVTCAILIITTRNTSR